MKRKTMVLILAGVLLLSGCGLKREKREDAVTTSGTDNVQTVTTSESPSAAVVSMPEPASTPIATPVSVPAPTVTPTPAPTFMPVPTPILTPTPTAAPQPTPTAVSGLPVVTKNPTDETVDAGGSCWFVAKYDNAIWAKWHFVSPDGSKDLTYDQVNTQFPNLKVIKGYASTTQLKNIPAEMNGWKAFCRFSNKVGSTDTTMATITVKSAANTQATASPASSPAAGFPVVTKNPTDETVDAGGSCWFVAKYDNAIWAKWHFVSPDGSKDLTYDQINTQFPNLKVIKGYASTTQLKNIPAEMNGWKAFCRFSNKVGSTDTTMATLNVKSNGTVPPVTSAPVLSTMSPTGGSPKVTKNPTDETVDAGGSCWFVAKYENAMWASWHFVSPDGSKDLTYDQINTQFPSLEVVKGYASSTQLKNIPSDMNGWKVYCRLSNQTGSTDTTRATLYVKPSAQSATVVPAQTQQSNERFYSGTTSLSNTEVESFAAKARRAYLDHDWTTMSEMIQYPITILNTQLTDASAFLNFMKDKTTAAEDTKNMEEETCRNMFNNGQGICMGGGEIWIRDSSYMTGNTPKLGIVALSGIVSNATVIVIQPNT